MVNGLLICLCGASRGCGYECGSCYRAARSLLVFSSRSHVGEDRRANLYQWNQGWGTPGYASCEVSFTPIAYSFCVVMPHHVLPASYRSLLYLYWRRCYFCLGQYDANTSLTTSSRELAVAYFPTTDAFFFSSSSFPLEELGDEPPNPLRHHATLYIHSQRP